MDLLAFRTMRALSQEECAFELGLKSKSYISGIESGAQPASIRLALQIQVWSKGAVPARELVSEEDRQLMDAAAAVARAA